MIPCDFFRYDTGALVRNTNRFSLRYPPYNRRRIFYAGILQEGFEIITDPDVFDEVKDALEKSGYELLSAEITMLPQTYTKLDENLVKSMDKLIDMLEDDDDIQDIYTNLEA